MNRSERVPRRDAIGREHQMQALVLAATNARQPGIRVAALMTEARGRARPSDEKLDVLRVCFGDGEAVKRRHCLCRMNSAIS
jgi:hypothetical protein